MLPRQQGFPRGPSDVDNSPYEDICLFNITVINDSLVELDELFQVLITSLPGQDGVESGEIKPVEFEPIIRIIDDDGMMLCV